MLTPEEARRRVLERTGRLAPRRQTLDHALGCVLAEDITSDVDSPPHDKSIVDGYAVRLSDFRDGTAELAVVEEILAGHVPTRVIEPGQTARIMTGAPLPAGAEAVVMVERSTRVESVQGCECVRLVEPQLRAGQNILRRATSLRQGEIVLGAGRRIRPQEIALLAEVGAAQLDCVPRPTLAVVSTGDELVSAAERPGAGQIRNSNEPMLVACARRAGAEAVGLGIVHDDAVALESVLRRGLQYDVLVLSGGVSAGVRDLVPAALAAVGVETVFHKIQMKPGKPLWFGVHAARPTLVFGLPGNPVSSFVGFELFVRPALAQLAGLGAGEPRRIVARLTRDFVQRGDRETFFPTAVAWGVTGWQATPVDWHGSADIRGLVVAHGLACFPAGDRTFPEGSPVEVLLDPETTGVF